MLKENKEKAERELAVKAKKMALVRRQTMLLKNQQNEEERFNPAG